MHRRTLRRAGQGTACGVLLAVVGSIAGGAPILTGGTFTLPTMGNSQPLWTGNQPRVSSTVTTTNGRTRVEGTSGGVVKLFGLAPNGFTLILEGAFDQVKAIAMQNQTAGTYQVRGPTDSTYGGSDRTIGSGSAALPSGSYTFYAADAALPRLAVVQAGAYAVQVTDGTSPLVSVDAGDSTFVARTGTRFGVSGQGTVSYSVSDVTTAMNVVTGTASAISSNCVDAASVDGTLDLTVALTNNCPNPVNVSWRIGSGSTTVTPVASGQTLNFCGPLTLFQWQYGGLGTVGFSITGH
jgi:hypothetical protein